MVENHEIERRGRGRPQVRCDEDTKSVVIDAADTHFQESGYAAASISAVAQSAGVSTKTLYRLFPTKADLFQEVISDRIQRFFLALDVSALAGAGLREGLVRMLVAYGTLTLSPSTVTMTRLVMGESDRFPEIATAFYKRAILSTNAVMENWLRTQRDRGLLTFDDPHMASGMLRGMMIMEPQRAAMLRQENHLTPEEIAHRAEVCADLFLNGFGSGQ